jgi:hypothetical protein
MILHRALADTKIRRDNLTRLPRNNPLQNLTLPHGQTDEMTDNSLPPNQVAVFTQEGAFQAFIIHQSDFETSGRRVEWKFNFHFFDIHGSHSYRTK